MKWPIWSICVCHPIHAGYLLFRWQDSFFGVGKIFIVDSGKVKAEAVVKTVAKTICCEEIEDFWAAGFPSQVKGAGLRALSRRCSRVRIPSPAYNPFSYIVFADWLLLLNFCRDHILAAAYLVLNSYSQDLPHKTARSLNSLIQAVKNSSRGFKSKKFHHYYLS